MTREQILLAQIVLGAAVACALVVAVVLAVQVSRLRREVAQLRSAGPATPAEAPEAPEAPASSESSTTRPSESEEVAFVITHLDDRELEHRPVPARIEGRLFADIVARETVVRAGGLAHGLRRALAPEVRNRIGFEMRREVKRARKQRRDDLKAALRDLQARRRAETRATGDEVFGDGNVA